MLTQIIWLSGSLMTVCLLVRAITDRFYSKYVVFYIYLTHVLLLSCLRYYLYYFNPGAYRTIYWYTQFLSVAVGYCVIWEIYEQALAAYPGSLRMARQLVLGIFIVVVAKALSNSLDGPVWGPAETVLDLERNLRAVQVFLLLGVLALLRYYMVPIGRNLRGIVLGYGFFIGALVVSNTLWSQLGDTFQIWLQYFQSMAWLVTLTIWAATLWNYHPNPTPDASIAIERDYEWLSARTEQAVAKARGQLMGGVR